MEVRKGLYVGGWQELEEGLGKWTHILSLDGVHSQDTKTGGKDERTTKRMHVNILDLPTENILQHLTRCLGFISRALRKEGDSSGEANVLVHCHAGSSRSVAIVAAYLMREERIGYEDALEVIRKVNPKAQPNQGFEEQLHLYQEMGFRINVNNNLYRHHLLKQQTSRTLLRKQMENSRENLVNVENQSHQENHETNLEALVVEQAALSLAKEGKGAEEGEEEEEEEEEECTEGASNQEELLLLCRKCRSVLAVSSQIMRHDPPGTIGKVSRKKWQHTSSMQCSSVYVEPLKWMDEVEKGGNEGKLSCYKCKTRVGHFSWSGIQCSCSRWITPAFQIHKSKVDFVKAA